MQNNIRQGEQGSGFNSCRWMAAHFHHCVVVEGGLAGCRLRVKAGSVTVLAL
jgi:hypothetical protein